MLRTRRIIGFFETRKGGWLLVSVFLIGATIIRGLEIGHRDVWLDEAYAVFHSQGSIWSLLKELSHDSNPPLYNLFLMAWTSVFGIGKVVVRLPSLLFSLGSVLVLFRIGKRFFNLQTAIIATLFFVLSQLHLNQAQNARSYSLSSLLCLSSFFVYLRLFEKGRKADAFWLMVLSVLLILNHYSNFLIFFGQAIASFGWFRTKSKAFKMYWISQVLAFILFMPWLFYFYQNGLQGGENNPFMMGKLGGYAFTGGTIISNNVSWWIFCSVLFLVSAWAVKKGEIKVSEIDKSKLLVLLSWSFIPFTLAWVISGFSDFFRGQYLMYLSFGFWLLYGHVLSSMPVPKSIKVLLIATILVIAGVDLKLKRPINEDWNRVVSLIDEHDSATSAVILVPYYQSLPLVYALDESLIKQADYKILHGKLAERKIYTVDEQQDWYDEISELVAEDTIDKVTIIEAGTELNEWSTRLQQLLESKMSIVQQEEFHHTYVTTWQVITD